jgi:hypothetical protein
MTRKKALLKEAVKEAGAWIKGENAGYWRF